MAGLSCGLCLRKVKTSRRFTFCMSYALMHSYIVSWCKNCTLVRAFEECSRPSLIRIGLPMFASCFAGIGIMAFLHCEDREKKNCLGSFKLCWEKQNQRLLITRGPLYQIWGFLMAWICIELLFQQELLIFYQNMWQPPRQCVRAAWCRIMILFHAEEFLHAKAIPKYSCII